MPLDRAAARPQAVHLAEPRDEPLRCVELRVRRHGDLEISDDVHADAVPVFSIAVRADRIARPPALNRPILADEIVIADTRPAIREVPLMHRRRRDIGIRVADVVQDDDIRRLSIFERTEMQIRLADGQPLAASRLPGRLGKARQHRRQQQCSGQHAPALLDKFPTIHETKIPSLKL